MKLHSGFTLPFPCSNSLLFTAIVNTERPNMASWSIRDNNLVHNSQAHEATCTYWVRQIGRSSFVLGHVCSCLRCKSHSPRVHQPTVNGQMTRITEYTVSHLNISLQTQVNTSSSRQRLISTRWPRVPYNVIISEIKLKDNGKDSPRTRVVMIQ